MSQEQVPDRVQSQQRDFGEPLWQVASARVYPPGGSHRTTVRQGEALVLCLLPGGAIEFTD